jgi:hypothetical protein
LLESNKKLLDRLHAKNQMVLISGIVITVLASIMHFYYWISIEPLYNRSKVTKEIGVFRYRAIGRLTSYCSFKLKNGEQPYLPCSSDLVFEYQKGQEVVLYKFTNASGTVSYKIQNKLDMILETPNPSFKRDYLR